jgi:hypothetical protein
MGVIVHPEHNQWKPVFGSGYILNPFHPLNRGLRAWWLCNEGSGGIVTDIVGGCNATIAGTDVWQKTQNGTVLSCESTAQYAVIPRTFGFFDGTSPFTVSGVAKVTSISSVAQFIWHPRNERDVWLYLKTAGFSFGFWDTAERNATSSSGISANKYYTCTGVWDINNSLLRSYLNGVAGGTYAAGTPASKSGTGTIGLQYISAAQNSLKGDVYSLAIYDRVLSAAENMDLHMYLFGTPDNPRLLTLSGVTYFLPPSLYLRSLGISSAPTIALARQAAFYRALGITRASTAGVSHIQQFKRILTATASSAAALAKQMFRTLTATASSAAAIVYGRLFSRIMAATSSTVASLLMGLVLNRILAVTQASAIGFVRAISLIWALTQGPSVSLTKQLYSSLSVLAASSVALCRGYFRSLATTATSVAVLTVHKTIRYLQSLVVTTGSAASVAKAKIKYVANKFFGIEVGRR